MKPNYVFTNNLKILSWTDRSQYVVLNPKVLLDIDLLIFISLISSMQEIWSFEVDQPNESTSENSIKELIQTKEKELGIFLSYYFKREGAIAEKVSLGSEITFLTNLTGKFKLEFDLVHFNACLAINEQKRDLMEISFEFDSGFKNLTLTGPYWPEREMDEI